MMKAAGETTMLQRAATVLLVTPLLLLAAMRAAAVPTLFLAGDSTAAIKLDTKAAGDRMG